MTTGRDSVLVAWNAAIVVLTLGAWLSMVYGWFGAGMLLNTTGVGSLKYYTILSNLLSAAASAWLVASLLGGECPRIVFLAKFAATTSVMVTFLVTLVFLGPTMGYAIMYAGPNLFLHLVLPLMALMEVWVLWPRLGLSLGDTAWAVVPTLAYAVFYYGNILVNGVGEPPALNDWYGFTVWGLDRMPIVFVVVVLVAWAIALAIRALNGSPQP